MPGCALASLARLSGGGKILVSCNRADSPCSWLSLMWSPRARPARPPCLAEGRATGGGSPRPSKLETLERERGGDGRPDERVTAQRAGRLPHARLHHRLRCLSGRDIGTDDPRRAPAVRPLEGELERVARVEVPQLGGVDAMRCRDLAVEQEVVDRAAAGPLAPSRVGHPGPAIPTTFGMGGQVEGS